MNISWKPRCLFHYERYNLCISTWLIIIITGKYSKTVPHARTHTSRRTRARGPSFNEAVTSGQLAGSPCSTELRLYGDKCRPMETRLFMTHRMLGFNYRDRHLRHPESFPGLHQLVENCCPGLHLGICNTQYYDAEGTAVSR